MDGIGEGKELSEGEERIDTSVPVNIPSKFQMGEAGKGDVVIERGETRWVARDYTKAQVSELLD